LAAGWTKEYLGQSSAFADLFYKNSGCKPSFIDLHMLKSHSTELKVPKKLALNYLTSPHLTSPHLT
jgi:hypothetical protein